MWIAIIGSTFAGFMLFGWQGAVAALALWIAFFGFAFAMERR